MRLKDIDIVVFDTETTGLSADSYIVEIGAVKLRGGRIVDTFSQFVRPPLPIPRDVVKVHGITDGMVRDAPSFPKVFRRFSSFIKGALLVAHNAPFDMKIMASNIIRAEEELPDNPVIDTCNALRRLFPNMPSYSLKYLARSWRSPYGGFHRALQDAKHTAYILYLSLEKCGITGDSSVEEFLKLYGPPIYFSQFERVISIQTPKDAFETIVRAIDTDRYLEILYENGRELKTRVVPLNLFNKHNRWYLRAIFLADDRERVLRLDRIKRVRLV